MSNCSAALFCAPFPVRTRTYAIVCACSETLTGVHICLALSCTCVPPGVAILQDLESLRELLRQDVVHGRDVLPELGVNAAVDRAHVEQALGCP